MIAVKMIDVNKLIRKLEKAENYFVSKGDPSFTIEENAVISKTLGIVADIINESSVSYVVEGDGN